MSADATLAHTGAIIDRTNLMVDVARAVLADAAHHQTPCLTMAACIIAEFTHGEEQSEAITLLAKLSGRTTA